MRSAAETGGKLSSEGASETAAGPVALVCSAAGVIVGCAAGCVCVAGGVGVCGCAAGVVAVAVADCGEEGKTTVTLVIETEADVEAETAAEVAAETVTAVGAADWVAGVCSCGCAGVVGTGVCRFVGVIVGRVTFSSCLIPSIDIALLPLSCETTSFSSLIPNNARAFDDKTGFFAGVVVCVVVCGVAGCLSAATATEGVESCALVVAETETEGGESKGEGVVATEGDGEETETGDISEGVCVCEGGEAAAGEPVPSRSRALQQHTVSKKTERTLGGRATRNTKAICSINFNTRHT